MKPTYLIPIIENIPAELKSCPQWVLWKAETRDGKETKPLHKPGGGYAKSNNPLTWSTFDAVKKALARFDGIGFVLTKDDPFVGIDFDECYCPAFDIIDPAIEEHIKLINTYTEISPSGKGLRLLLRGRLLVDGRKNRRVEVYQSKRYVTITGHRLPSYPAFIEARQAELETFYQKSFPEKAEAPKQPPGNARRVSQSFNCDWRNRLQIAFRSKTGDKIKKLYDGDWSDHLSQSEGDMALCAHLAFYLSGDPATVDAAFRESGLFRPKWNEQHGEKTYGQMTIDKAIQGCKEFYQEPSAKPHDRINHDARIIPTHTQKIDEPEKETRSHKGKATLLTLDDTKKCFSQGVSYLWRKHILRGMPHLVAAREGIGKTTICIGIGNEILTNNPEGMIIWIASEGFLQDTLDKTQKLGVDNKRFLLFQNSNETFQFSFDKQSDRTQLDNILSECRKSDKIILAVFIDSIRGITPYGDNDSLIKNVMLPLNSIVCDKYRAALIYIDHHKKGEAATELDKLVGTTAKAAAVRRVFSVVTVSTYVRKIILAKSNILCDPPPELMAALSQEGLIIYEVKDSSDVSLIAQAEQWLIKVFSERGTYKANDIYDMGLKFGYSSDVLKKAKQHLNINAEQPGGVGKPWYWKCDTFLNTDLLVTQNNPSGENDDF